MKDRISRLMARRFGGHDSSTAPEATPPARPADGDPTRVSARAGLLSALKPLAGYCASKLTLKLGEPIEYGTPITGAAANRTLFAPGELNKNERTGTTSAGERKGAHANTRRPVKTSMHKALDKLAPSTAHERRAGSEPVLSAGVGAWLATRFPGDDENARAARTQLASQLATAAPHDETRQCLLADGLAIVTDGDGVEAQKVAARLARGLRFAPEAARSDAAAPKPAPKAPAPLHIDEELIALASVAARLEAKLNEATGTGDEIAAMAPEPSNDAMTTDLPADPRIDAMAWRAAQLLAQTSTGYASLQALAGANWPAASGAAPRVWLRAADALVSAGACEASFESVTRYAREQARRVPPGPHAHLAGIAAAAGKLLGGAPPDALGRAEKGLYMAGLQGFYEDGPGSDFAAAKERLLRVVKHWIPRAPHANTQRFGQRVFGYQKNPLRAARFGVTGGNLASHVKERAKLDALMLPALHELSAKLAVAPAASRDAASAMSALVVRAELQYWLAHPERVRYAARLDDAALDEIADQVARQIAARPPLAPGASSRERRVDAWLRAFSARLRNEATRARSLERMSRSLAGRSRVLDIGKCQAWRECVPGSQHEQGFERWEKLSRRAAGSPIEPADLSPESLQQAFDELIDNLESGGRSRLADGGVAGVSTRGLSANVSNLLHLVGAFVSPRLDLRYSRGRHAFFQCYRSTGSYGITAGTSRRHRGQAGAGLQGGPQFKGAAAQLRVGANVDFTFVQADQQTQRSVTLGFARRVNAAADGFDDARAKRKLHELNAFLFGVAATQRATDPQQAPGTHAQALWDELADQFAFDDDLFVSSTGQRDRSLRSGVSASAGLNGSIALGPATARIGPQFGAAYDRTHHVSSDSADTAGRLQSEVHRIGKGWSVAATAGVGISFGTPRAAHGPQGYGVPLADGGRLRKRLSDRLTVSKVTLVREGGQLAHRACLAERELTNLAAYARELRADPQLALLLGLDEATARAYPHELTEALAQDGSVASGLDGGPLAHALQKGRALIDEHLDWLEAHSKLSNQRHVLRSRLRRDVARELDALTDRIALLRRRANPAPADTREIASLEALWRARIDDPASWLPAEIKTIERIEPVRTRGFFFSVQLGTERSSGGEREFAAKGAVFRSLEAVDDAFEQAGA